MGLVAFMPAGCEKLLPEMSPFRDLSGYIFALNKKTYYFYGQKLFTKRII